MRSFFDPGECCDGSRPSSTSTILHPTSTAAAMVVQIPPGLAYLCLNLPRVFTPAITVYSFAVIIRRAFDIRVSPWLMTLTYISLLPVAFCLSVLWRDLKNKRRANSLGAVLPPRISGRLPGSVDMLWIGSKLRYTAYPGGRERLIAVAFLDIERR